jgi:hypothetical protein
MTNTRPITTVPTLSTVILNRPLAGFCRTFSAMAASFGSLIDSHSFVMGDRPEDDTSMEAPCFMCVPKKKVRESRRPLDCCQEPRFTTAFHSQVDGIYRNPNHVGQYSKEGGTVESFPKHGSVDESDAYSRIFTRMRIGLEWLIARSGES